MASIVVSGPTSSTQRKVTLTNWERLNNAPHTFNGASAVQWNDYVFVLTRNGMALLYHTKNNIWSALPRTPYYSGTSTQALTVHNGQILTMSTLGKMTTFDPQLGDWTEVNDMNITPPRVDYNRILVSYNSNLYTIATLKEIYDYNQRRTHLPLDEKDCCTIFSYNPNSKWTVICEFGKAPLQSAAIVAGTAFIYTGGEVYKVLLQKNQTKAIAQSSSTEVVPAINIPPKIASPPYEGFTLYAIKDTLFSFGGRDRDHQPTSDVLRYNPDTDTWESAGYMRSARYDVAVTTMQDTTLDVFVLGGSFGSSEYIVKERIYTGEYRPGGQSSTKWDNQTSILEKCTVDYT